MSVRPLNGLSMSHDHTSAIGRVYSVWFEAVVKSALVDLWQRWQTQPSLPLHTGQVKKRLPEL